MTFSKLGTDTQTGQIVELPQASRRQGLYIIGANGTGKTGLIEHLILQDIDQGLGVGLLDPHGDLTNAILSKMTKRVDDVILLDITDKDYPFGLNLFECHDPTNPVEVQKIVDLVMHIFEKLFDVSRAGTPLLLDYLRNCTSVLVANPGYTMADIPLLFADQSCRQKLLATITDPYVRLFWQQYEQLPLKEQREEAASTMRRVREFLQPLSRTIVGQAQTTVDMFRVMDERKILLVKLSAQLDQVTSLIGSVIIAMALNAAYSRASLPVNKRKQFNLYADEFQRFATEDFATLLTEARKFGIATTIAHQARYQPGMTDGIRAVSLQAANFVVFRVTSLDADELAGSFDTTPPPPQQEEATRRAIQTPVREPIQYMLHKGVHPHQAVRQFMETYGKALVLGAEKEEEAARDNRRAWDKYLSESPVGRRTLMPSIGVSSNCRTALDTLNSLFYEAMIAGKEGKNVDAIAFPVGFIDLIIREFRITEGKSYLDALELYNFYISHLGVQVTDLPARALELQARLASFSPYSREGKIKPLQAVNNIAQRTLQDVYKKFLHAEVAAVRKRFLIAEKPSILSTRFTNAFEQNAESRHSDGATNLLYVNQHYWHSNSHEYDGKLMKWYDRYSYLFPTWEEAVMFHLRQYRHLWFHIDEQALLDIRNWIQTKRQVEWTVVSNKEGKANTQKTTTDILTLKIWEPYAGIEQSWYTTTMLATEVAERMNCYSLSEAQRTLEEYQLYTSMDEELKRSTHHSIDTSAELENTTAHVTNEEREETRKIEYELDLLNKVAAAKPAYDVFVAQFTAVLREVMQILAVQRIEEDSGQQEVVYRPGPVRPYQDIKNDIANQLSGLPNFTARVKLGENAPQNPGKKCLNCGRQNNSGAKFCQGCGTQLPAPNEYTITTLKPIGGIGKAAFDQRIAYIQTRNRDPRYGGYCRPRQDVEAEITNRQTGCSGGAAPAQPHRPPQQPQPQRFARQVPVQGKCQNCGASNPPGAKFCNQCGGPI